MGDALTKAAAELEAAANEINAIDLSQEQESVAAFVNNIANAINSLSQAIGAAKEAFTASLQSDQMQAQPGAPQVESPTAEPQA
jgi:hypothetical protein